MSRTGFPFFSGVFTPTPPIDEVGRAECGRRSRLRRRLRPSRRVRGRAVGHDFTEKSAPRSADSPAGVERLSRAMCRAARPELMAAESPPLTGDADRTPRCLASDLNESATAGRGSTPTGEPTQVRPCLHRQPRHDRWPRTRLASPGPLPASMRYPPRPSRLSCALSVAAVRDQGLGEMLASYSSMVLVMLKVTRAFGVLGHERLPVPGQRIERRVGLRPDPSLRPGVRISGERHRLRLNLETSRTRRRRATGRAAPGPRCRGATSGAP